MRDHHTRRAVIAGFVAIPTLSAATAAADAHMSLLAFGQKLNPVSQATGQEPPTVASSPAWPDAATTGVPKDTTLTNIGDITTSAHGQVISGLNVNGVINVNHSGVTVRKCRVKVLFIHASDCTMEDCEITGVSWNSAVNILAAGGTIRRCNVSGSENGIWIEGDNCLVEDNYIHNLHWPSADPHIDGIQPTGCKNLIIRHNNIDLDVATASSSISIKDGVNNVIENNRLNGGSYIIYFEGASSGCTVTNNLFLEHAFGYVAGRAAGAQTYKDNVFAGRGNHRKSK